MFKMLRVKQFVKNIDDTIKVKRGKRLECDIENKIIYISFKSNKTDVKTFLELVKELNPKCKYNDVILGILHEIGHIYTYDEYNEEQWEKDNQLLSELYSQNLITATDFNKFYIRLPLEQNATQWAIDFSMLNQGFMNKYAKVIK